MRIVWFYQKNEIGLHNSGTSPTLCDPPFSPGASERRRNTSSGYAAAAASIAKKASTLTMQLQLERLPMPWHKHLDDPSPMSFSREIKWQINWYSTLRTVNSIIVSCEYRGTRYASLWVIVSHFSTPFRISLTVIGAGNPRKCRGYMRLIDHIWSTSPFRFELKQSFHGTVFTPVFSHPELFDASGSSSSDV